MRDFFPWQFKNSVPRYSVLTRCDSFANQSLQSPTTRCPSSPVSGGRCNGQADRNPRRRNGPPTAVPTAIPVQQTNVNPKRARSKAREMAALGGGGNGGDGLRHPQRAPIHGTAVPNPALVALVPTHTIDIAPEVIAAVAAARRRKPIASSSATAFTSTVGGTWTGVQVGHISDTRNATSRPRPRTSTGCERRARSGNDRNARRKVGPPFCWRSMRHRLRVRANTSLLTLPITPTPSPPSSETRCSLLDFQLPRHRSHHTTPICLFTCCRKLA